MVAAMKSRCDAGVAQTMAKCGTERAAIVPREIDVWAAYEAQMDAAPRTRETYMKALGRWRAWLDAAGIRWDGAGRDAVVAWRASMAGEGMRPNTINAYLSAVRSFYRWTEARGLCPNIAADVKGLKTSKKSAKDSLTVEQAREYVAPTAGARTLKELRDDAMAVLMLTRGLRTIEVARADAGDVRQINGVAVLMVQGKGYTDKGEFVVLSPEVLNPIYEYLQARGRVRDDDPLFASVSSNHRGGRMTTRAISGICKNRLRERGMSSARLTAHSLRHTAVTLALLAGASVQEVQQMARHSNIETTMIYAHNIDRMRGAAEHAVDRAVFGL